MWSPFFFALKVRLAHIELNYAYIAPSAISDESTILIFAHEALGSIEQWKSFPTKLCEELGLNGFVYERQGHGASSRFSKERDEQYLHDYAFEELPAFIESVVPPFKKILLIGHSDGGTISLLYGSKFPERIAGIVTMAAHVINEPETIAGIQPAVEAYEMGKLIGLKKYHGDKTHELFYAWANIWRDQRFLNWDIVGEIGSDSPGLFIQGKNDQYGTSRQLELIQSKFNNGTTLLLDDCAHHPHLEKTNEVIAAISTFYRSIIS